MMSIPESEAETLAADSWSVTQSRVVKFSHVWKIENFSFYQKDKVIVSPPFSAVADDEAQWCFKVFPNGKSEESKDYISIYLSLVSSKLGGLPAKYKISILNASKQAVQTMENNEALRFKCGKGWGFCKFISRDFLLTNCEGCLPEDTLTVFCEVTTLSEAMAIFGRNSSNQTTQSVGDRSDDLDGNGKEFTGISRFSDPQPSASDCGYEPQFPEDKTSYWPTEGNAAENQIPKTFFREYQSSFDSAKELISVLQKENQLLTDMVANLKHGMLRAVSTMKSLQENPANLPLDVAADKLLLAHAESLIENTERSIRSQTTACSKMLNELAAADEFVRWTKSNSSAESLPPTNLSNTAGPANLDRAQSTSSAEQPPTNYSFLRSLQEHRLRPEIRSDRFSAVAGYVPGHSMSAPASLEAYAQPPLDLVGDPNRRRSVELPRVSNFNEMISNGNSATATRQPPIHELEPRPSRKISGGRSSGAWRPNIDQEPMAAFNYHPYPVARSTAEPSRQCSD